MARRRNPCHCAGEGGCESLIYALLCRRPREGWRLALMSGLKTKLLRLVFKTLAHPIFEPSISHLPLLHIHDPGKLEPPEHIILFNSNKTCTSETVLPTWRAFPIQLSDLYTRQDSLCTETGLIRSLILARLSRTGPYHGH